MQFAVSFEFMCRYCNQVHRNVKICSIYQWNQNKTKAENKCSSWQWGYLYISLSIFDYKALFLCVKYRTCLRIAMPGYCFNIFGSSFGFLFCLLIKMCVLGSRSIWEGIRKVSCAVWSVRTFRHTDKVETVFYWKLHIGIVWIFLNKLSFH